ncbi:hypothetical protein [Candidatus Soleaferrea massiliensis]|uniref:hypothetical protein n=1 Tax=Candidatus Soleaferrea massiliensis TaxID=1470354 RepID=UPI00058E4398|nr:hypothetical protein [Candidatus Soleaferrea massiliensis]
MKRTWNTSAVPMVLGLAGGIVGVPFATRFSGLLAGISNIGTGSARLAGVYSFLMLAGSLMGILFALLSKKRPMTSCAGFILSAAMVGVTLGSFHALTLTITLLFFFAAVVCLMQRRTQLLHLMSCLKGVLSKKREAPIETQHAAGAK